MTFLDPDEMAAGERERERLALRGQADRVLAALMADQTARSRALAAVARTRSTEPVPDDPAEIARRLVEYADAARPDEQAHDDQHDAYRDGAAD